MLPLSTSAASTHSGAIAPSTALRKRPLRRRGSRKLEICSSGRRAYSKRVSKY